VSQLEEIITFIICFNISALFSYWGSYGNSFVCCTNDQLKPVFSTDSLLTLCKETTHPHSVFLCAGIECPRGSRNMPGGMQVAEPYSDEAMLFTKELTTTCIKRSWNT